MTTEKWPAIRVSPDVRRQLKSLAEREGGTMGEVVERALRAYRKHKEYVARIMKEAL